MTSAQTIASLSPLDAYTLGMLDERLRAAERAREELVERIERSASAPKPSKPKPKAPPAPSKELELPHVNGEASSEALEQSASPSAQ